MSRSIESIATGCPLFVGGRSTTPFVAGTLRTRLSLTDLMDDSSSSRRARFRRALFLAAMLSIAVVAAGCAGLPPNVIRTPSLARPASLDTTLGRTAADSTPDASLSGFRLLPSSPFALDTRLELIRRAERSIDIQYFLVERDATGRSFLRELRDAARRGVRVRLLLDDVNTVGMDDLLLGLAAEPNVELRLFNPFPGGRDTLFTRFASSLAQFERLNHRMHNKLFIADGAMAVAGGRNIADEYFARREIANFIDLDVFVIGAVVPHLAALFDQYWNSQPAYPLESIVWPGASAMGRRARFDKLTAQVQTPPLEGLSRTDVLGYGPIADELTDGKLGLIWGNAEAFADAPSAVAEVDPRAFAQHLDERPVRFNVFEHIREAKSEVVLVTPYLIPGKGGMALIRNVRARGVAVSILTNSLASTDQPFVHAGYRPYRKRLLEAGVDLYELSATKANRTSRWRLPKAAVGGLHAKTAIFDRNEVFVGSMNLDPRSEHYNTELGIIFHSPELARESLRLINYTKSHAAHRLLLAPDGSIRWFGPADSDDGTHTEEPETSLWQRTLLDLLGPFAPEELL